MSCTGKCRHSDRHTVLIHAQPCSKASAHKCHPSGLVGTTPFEQQYPEEAKCITAALVEATAQQAARVAARPPVVRGDSNAARNRRTKHLRGLRQEAAIAREAQFAEAADCALGKEVLKREAARSLSAHKGHITRAAQGGRDGAADKAKESARRRFIMAEAIADAGKDCTNQLECDLQKNLARNRVKAKFAAETRNR